MEEQPKTVPDSAFARSVLAERDALQDSDALNAAERAGVRELLGFLDDLRAIVATERFQKEAWARVGGIRDGVKLWALAIGAILGLAGAAITVFKSFWG